MNIEDLWRYGNALAALFGLWLLLLAYKRQRHDWTVKTHDHWWALVGWVALAVLGSLEQIYQDVEFGVRTVGLSLVLAWTIRALLRKGELRAKRALAR